MACALICKSVDQQPNAIIILSKSAINYYNPYQDNPYIERVPPIYSVYKAPQSRMSIDQLLQT